MSKTTHIKSFDTICTRGDWCKTTMEEQEHPEKLKEVAMTVAGVILKQKMSDTNPLGRDCKLEFVFVENFKNQVSSPNFRNLCHALLYVQNNFGPVQIVLNRSKYDFCFLTLSNAIWTCPRQFGQVKNCFGSWSF